MSDDKLRRLLFQAQIQIDSTPDGKDVRVNVRIDSHSADVGGVPQAAIDEAVRTLRKKVSPFLRRELEAVE